VKARGPFLIAKSKDPYPVTRDFRRDLSVLRSPGVKEIGESLARMLKEYEHGTADVGDLAPGMTVKSMAAVLMEGLMHVDGEWR
jgi:hypothetical protein